MVRLDLNVSDPFEIVVGTYEQYLLGYKVDNVVNEYKMEKTFATHSHIASVRSLDTKKHYLASGGADDSVCLYDMNHRMECGKLVHHNDTVNCIAFTPEASHMFTCSNDGSIAAIRCGNWQIEKHWKKPHKGLAVNAVAIHPTGKIALSTGADGILRTWNLVKGRQAYATNLTPRMKLDARNVTVLKWSPNGEKYLLAVNQRIDIYSVELAGIDSEIKLDAKIVCVEFLKDNLIAVGLENGQIRFYDLEKSEQTVEAVAHDIRVKCMSFVDDLLVTASSSGEIKLWRYSKNSLDMLQSINCGARITCLTLALTCNNFDSNKEVILEQEKEEVKKKKFRLYQEVVIEKEGDWAVTPINQTGSPDEKKKKKKKKRIQTEETDVQEIPNKRKKELKKKRRREDAEEENDQRNDSIPREKKRATNENVEDEKMKKKRNESISYIKEVEQNPIVRKAEKPKGSKGESILGTNGGIINRLKKKSTRLGENDDEIPAKKKKKSKSETNGTILRKKKKKKT
ncbi:p21-activated protein kinase-interacting protein 1-like [Halictus rubicundus]|uniref:p21-activated protein kinase-interacting protein 1-like n=1 Tax=Halictus rubicundus TaxID=77578 RepID=UPI004035FDD6